MHLSTFAPSVAENDIENLASIRQSSSTAQLDHRPATADLTSSFYPSQRSSNSLMVSSSYGPCSNAGLGLCSELSLARTDTSTRSPSSS